jgi:hypothetical protein
MLNGEFSSSWCRCLRLRRFVITVGSKFREHFCWAAFLWGVSVSLPFLILEVSSW